MILKAINKRLAEVIRPAFYLSREKYNLNSALRCGEYGHVYPN